MGATDEWTGLLGGFIVAGAGIGLLNPVIADVALSVVPKEQSGMASGINDTFRQVGVAVGVACGAIFPLGAASKVGGRHARAATSRAGSWRSPRRNSTRRSRRSRPGPACAGGGCRPRGFLAGFNDISVSAGCVAFAAAIGAFWLVRERDIERGRVVEARSARRREPSRPDGGAAASRPAPAAADDSAE